MVRGDIMSLTVEMKKEDSRLSLYIKGILDISTVHILDSHFEDLQGIDVLIIDFSGLEFIDSTGVGCIINAIYLCQGKKFKIVLQGIDKEIHHVFKTVGLYKVLETVQGDVI